MTPNTDFVPLFEFFFANADTVPFSPVGIYDKFLQIFVENFNTDYLFYSLNWIWETD